jgi:hypothetical protein
LYPMGSESEEVRSVRATIFDRPLFLTTKETNSSASSSLIGGWELILLGCHVSPRRIHVLCTCVAIEYRQNTWMQRPGRWHTDLDMAKRQRREKNRQQKCAAVTVMGCSYSVWIQCLLEACTADFYRRAPGSLEPLQRHCVWLRTRTAPVQVGIENDVRNVNSWEEAHVARD